MDNFEYVEPVLGLKMQKINALGRIVEGTIQEVDTTLYTSSHSANNPWVVIVDSDCKGSTHATWKNILKEWTVV